MLGRFHEISIETGDIRASVEFYERLGFSQAVTGDTRTHPYGVLTDGRVFIGLHQRNAPSPSLTFVQPDIARHVAQLESAGIEIELARTGDEVFNEIAFRSPDGQHITVLEARTYSPTLRRPSETSLCGEFTELSIPVADFDAAKRFWEPLGFVAIEGTDRPYAYLSLTSDHLNLGFHSPAAFGGPMLVFSDATMRERLAKLQEMKVEFSRKLPHGLDPKRNALIETPEDTALLLLETQN